MLVKRYKKDARDSIVNLILELAIELPLPLLLLISISILF